MQGLVGEPLMARPADLVLWRSGRDYFAAGRKVFRLSGGNYAEPPQLQVLDEDLMQRLRGRRKGRRPNWLRRDPEETRALLGDANIVRLVRLEEEAISFLQDVRREHADLPLVVSWSGGKDSTVASVLAQRAFPDERIPHVFADTTIELPSTYEFMREFRRENPAVPFLIGMPARDFFELCREIGPPSRIQRWCCATHKAAPLTDVMRAVAGDSQVLAVTGLRRHESAGRQSYDRVSNRHKISIQLQVNPLVDWHDFDIWLWHLVHRPAMNEAYRWGLDRVGCMYCPSGGGWSDHLISSIYPAKIAAWRDVLVEVFSGSGVGDAESYVDSGQWRGRSTGKVGEAYLDGTQAYEIDTLPCHDDPCVVTYELAGEFDLRTLGELLKPFGSVNRQIALGASGDFEVTGRWGVFAVHAVPHWGKVRVTFADPAARRRLVGTIRLQLRKLQSCVGCGACAALCSHGAIVRVGSRYSISDAACDHCLKCVRGLRAGCQAAESLRTRQVRIGA